MATVELSKLAGILSEALLGFENSYTGIPFELVRGMASDLLLVMLPKAYLALHSLVSGSR